MKKVVYTRTRICEYCRKDFPIGLNTRKRFCCDECKKKYVTETWKQYNKEHGIK